jgi:hypothetical protein
MKKHLLFLMMCVCFAVVANAQTRTVVFQDDFESYAESADIASEAEYLLWESPQFTVAVGAAVSGTKYAVMHNTKTGGYVRKHMTVDKGSYTFEVQTMCIGGRNHRANVKVATHSGAESGGTPAHATTFWTNNVVPFTVEEDQTEIQLFIYSYFMDNDIYIDDFTLYKEGASNVKHVSEKIFSVSRLQNSQFEITGTTLFSGYKIYDLSGRTILSSNEQAVSYQLDLSKMTKGIYVLKVKGDQGTQQVERLILD